MNRLELTWLNKHKPMNLEPRIMLNDKSKNYGDMNTENLLIHGDNLLALKALEQKYWGQVKCCYADVPYNTGSAFEHYEDNLEHSTWLNLMRPRIEIMHNLLSPSGTLWVTLDDHEVHYLKVLIDEVFGRSNFVANVIWEKSDSPRMDVKTFSSRHDHILVYAKDIANVTINRLENESGEAPSHYNKTDSAGRLYYLKPLRSMGKNDAREARPNLYYAMIAPDGSEVYPIRTDGSDGNWRWSRDKVNRDNEHIEWVDGRNGWVPYYRIYADANSQRPPETIWFHQDVGSNRTSKAEIKGIFNDDKSFETPKPESLIKRVLDIATNPDDLILDAFLGSGTTAAVALKMRRKFIGIELGNHCYTHCIPRLNAVIDGTDQGGITKSQNWTGGGGYKFYELAPSLLQKDARGFYVINKEYNADMMAAAMAMHEGYTYAPDPEVYWKQGYSSERSFIYTTTNFLTVEYLDMIRREMKKGEHLLICCKRMEERTKKEYREITVRKIPNVLLGRCEYGNEDYSLNIDTVLKGVIDNE